MSESQKYVELMERLKQAENLANAEDEARRSAADCSVSSNLPTPHPSGAWDRSDFVREYDMRVIELRSTRNAVQAFLEEWSWMDGPEGWRESVQKLSDEILPQNSFIEPTP